MSGTTSRREFLALTGAALVGARAGLEAAQAPGGRLFAYIASQTAGPGFGVGKSIGIGVYAVNMSDGSLTQVSRTGPEAEDINCDGMCIGADGRFLYTTDTRSNFRGMPGAGGGVHAFAIDRQTGALRYLNAQPAMGANPAGVIVDKTGTRVLVANHGAVTRIVTITKRNGVPVVESPTDDATVSLFPVRPDGSLEPASDVSVFERRPLTDPGPGAAVHQVQFDPTQRFVVATDNGWDHLYVYPFDPTSRTLVGKSFPTPPGRAPRHIAFHPRAPFFLVTNEREPSVSSFRLDMQTGDLRAVQTIRSIGPGDPAERVTPSNIQMHPSGRFAYAANRGPQTNVAIIRLNEATGEMALQENVPSGGNNIREMAFDPSGRFLYVCNIASNLVTTFAVDPDSGRITLTGKTEVNRPSCVSFARL